MPAAIAMFSEDGLVTWTFLDAYLSPGNPLPIRKLMHAWRIPAKPIVGPLPGSTGRAAVSIQRSAEPEPQHAE